MNQVRKALAVLALTHARQMTQEMADFYIESFEGKNEKEVLEAIKKCTNELRFFPTIADIHQRIKSNIPNEHEIVGLIYEAVELYGYPNPEAARKHIGEIGWRAVFSVGGWMAICSTPSDQDSTLRAQLRMASLSVLNRYRSDPEGFMSTLARVNDKIENKGELKAVSFIIEDLIN